MKYSKISKSLKIKTNKNLKADFEVLFKNFDEVWLEGGTEAGAKEVVRGAAGSTVEQASLQDTRVFKLEPQGGKVQRRVLGVCGMVECCKS